MPLTWLIPIGFAALGAACVIPPLRMARRMVRYVRATVNQTSSGPWPRAAVILPCKGIAAELDHLEANLRCILTQDYPDYRVVFAVESADDLAAPTIRRLCEQFGNAELVVAEHSAACSQKVSNQLAAIERLAGDGEALVFMDSDAQPAPDVLRQLVAPLRNPTVGASTGFRWYTPSASAGGFGSWLRAAWNTGGMPFLAEPKYNYAWGGAMAVRREVFDRCGVADYWRDALSDDLGLSAVVKQAGLSIHWVPPCLVRSPEDLTLAQTLEWTSRQTVVCRVYNPVMWRDVLVGEAITSATLLGGAAALVTGLVRGDWPWAVGGALAIAIIVAGRMAYQGIILNVAARLAPHLLTRPARRRLIMLAPLVNPLMLHNSLRSWFSRRITWRGITYHLRGPRDIAILRRENMQPKRS